MNVPKKKIKRDFDISKKKTCISKETHTHQKRPTFPKPEKRTEFSCMWKETFSYPKRSIGVQGDD